MTKSKTIQAEVDRFAMRTYGITMTAAKDAGICLDCRATIHVGEGVWGPGSIYSDAGVREYEISGLCEFCFDSLLDEED